MKVSLKTKIENDQKENEKKREEKEKKFIYKSRELSSFYMLYKLRLV
jgi:hypothetical protein